MISFVWTTMLNRRHRSNDAIQWLQLDKYRWSNHRHSSRSTSNAQVHLFCFVHFSCVMSVFSHRNRWSGYDQRPQRIKRNLSRVGIVKNMNNTCRCGSHWMMLMRHEKETDGYNLSHFSHRFKIDKLNSGILWQHMIRASLILLSSIHWCLFIEQCFFLHSHDHHQHCCPTCRVDRSRSLFINVRLTISLSLCLCVSVVSLVSFL
jgi:hypothetical protein